MWCLESIIAINEELAKGHGLDQAYANCGILILGKKRLPVKKEVDKKIEVESETLSAVKLS